MTAMTTAPSTCAPSRDVARIGLEIAGADEATGEGANAVPSIEGRGTIGPAMVRDYPEKFTGPQIEAAIAAHRFGYGARPGELDLIADDPRGWLLDQLVDDGTPPELDGLPGTAELYAGMRRARLAGGDERRNFRQAARERLMEEAARRALLAVNGDRPFHERLVRFWTNHFTVSLRKPAAAPLVAAFEREAIRPNVTKRFRDMLMAVVRHPAMLLYLDNADSIGRTSDVGRGRAPALRQSLARELLDRHTMGPDGKFTRQDVRALAEMLTGWTVGVSGDFAFRPDWHEGNAKRFLGRVYPDVGVLQGEAALEFLSRSVATGRRLAFRMAQHFVADDPPKELVDHLFHGFVDSGTSCLGLARALVLSSHSWAREQRKVKTPEQLVYSGYRALGLYPRSGRPVAAAVRALGQPTWSALTPAGWPEMATHWLAPESVLERLEWASALAAAPAAADPTPPTDRALDVLGGLLRPETYRRMRAALTEREAMALMLASPEFQTR